MRLLPHLLVLCKEIFFIEGQKCLVNRDYESNFIYFSLSLIICRQCFVTACVAVLMSSYSFSFFFSIECGVLDFLTTD